MAPLSPPEFTMNTYSTPTLKRAWRYQGEPKKLTVCNLLLQKAKLNQKLSLQHLKDAGHTCS